MDRPDYVKCIQHSHEDKKCQTWCGRTIDPGEYTILSIDTAVYDIMQQGSVVPCWECRCKIVEILEDV